MEKDQLYNLKSQVIRSFVAHELGEPLSMSDKVWDEKLALIKSADPNFNIYDYQPNVETLEYVPHRYGMTDLEKEKVHDLTPYWTYEEGIHKTPKYDGSSVVIYYTLGKFTRVVSMRDKESGCDQTEKFRSFVPQEVDPNISYIRCECLIDIRLDKNARGKANGLVNSKYMQDDIEELATLMAFCAHDLEGNMIPFEEFKKLSKFNSIRENGVPRFFVSPEVQDLTLSEKVVLFSDHKTDFQFAIDGIVYYEDHSAYKYDYVDSALTTVLGINWNETEKEGWFPTISVDPVEVDGAEVRNPSSNGVPNMIKMGIAVGSTVEVVRSGLTIPKIIDCVDPQPVEFPTCPYCGYKMSEEDLYGSNLKCGNRDCQGKLDLRKSWIKEWEDNEKGNKAKVVECLHGCLENALFSYLNVSRFNYENARLFDVNEVKVNEVFDEYLKNNDEEGLESWIGDHYKWTELQWSECWLNIVATFKALREYLYE